MTSSDREGGYLGQLPGGCPILRAVDSDAVGPRDGPSRVRPLDQRDLRAGAQRALLQHAQVPAESPAALDQLEQLGSSQ